MSDNNFFNVAPNLSDDCSTHTDITSSEEQKNESNGSIRCTKCGAQILKQQKFCDRCGNPIVDKIDISVGLSPKKSKKKIIIPIAIVCLVLSFAAVVGLFLLISSNSIKNKLEGEWDTLGINTELDRFDYKEVPNDYVYVEVGIQKNGGYIRYWDKGMMLKESEIDQVGVSYFQLGDGNTLLVEKPSPNSITGGEKKDLFSGMYQYSQAAMSGNKDTWYLDGDTLYINGITLYRL